MRRSKANWKPRDLKTLYKGYGFIIDESHGRHDKATHPDFPELIGYIPRHPKLAVFVVVNAIKKIDQLIELQKFKERRDNEKQDNENDQ